jgi:predicted ATPase
VITRVRVKNFRSLADVDVELGPLTVLVGRNGSGKSAFVDVLRFMRDALLGGLDSAITKRGGIVSLLRYPSDDDAEIEISVTVQLLTLEGEYTLAIGNNHGRATITRERCVATAYDLNRSGDIDAAPTGIYELNRGQWSDDTTLQKEFCKALSALSEEETDLLLLPRVIGVPVTFFHIYRFLTNTQIYVLYPEELRPPQKPANDPVLLEDLSNFASVLSRIQEEGRIPELSRPLSQIVSNVKGLRVVRHETYIITELQHQKANGATHWFALFEESDGTIRFLALLIALYQIGPGNQPRPGRLIAIEEPELMLYPGAVGVLSDVIHEAALRQQILITTQSPDLISQFAVSELRVVEQEDGITQIGPLDARQRDVINEELFSGGDLLRIEGLRRAPVTITE